MHNLRIVADHNLQTADGRELSAARSIATHAAVMQRLLARRRRCEHERFGLFVARLEVLDHRRQRQIAAHVAIQDKNGCWRRTRRADWPHEFGLMRQKTAGR